MTLNSSKTEVNSGLNEGCLLVLHVASGARKAAMKTKAFINKPVLEVTNYYSHLRISVQQLWPIPYHLNRPYILMHHALVSSLGAFCSSFGLSSVCLKLPSCQDHESLLTRAALQSFNCSVPRSFWIIPGLLYPLFLLPAPRTIPCHVS